MTTTFRIERDPHVCDFCTDPKVVAAYQCDDFMWEKDSILPHQSEGAWSACAVCSALIDAGKWNELTDRCLDIFCRTHGVGRHDRLALRVMLKELHARFREHMRRAV